MNALTANLDPIATMALEATPYLPRDLFFKMLRTAGGVAPVTAESRKAAKAAKTASQAPAARKPMSEARKKFLAGYFARKRAAERTAAAA